MVVTEDAMERTIERDLVKSAQDGDLSAFEALVGSCREGILVELTNLLGSHDDAEDVAQDAFLRAFMKLSTLREPCSFGGWVRQIARNIARNRIARCKVFLSLEEYNTGYAEETTHEGDKDFDLGEVPAIAALSRLSSRLRETARLAYLIDLPQQQVADRLGVPLGTVKRRLWEGRGRMKKEVLGMSRIGRQPEALKVAPKIGVRDLPGEKMRVTTLGPGLYFGSILEEGRSEVCDFFDYPGGILTQSVQTQAVRKVEIPGGECFEMLVEHTDCEPPMSNHLDYFRRTEKGFLWIMRVTADGQYPAVRFMGDEELFPLCYSSGGHRNYSAKAVTLRIGDGDFGRCLSVFWGWESGTPAESFYTEQGQQVLHRRYVGPEARISQNYCFDKLREEERRTFRGTEYRLWYDTVIRE